MKREELKTLDLLCDMGIDVNGNRNLQPWKAYDIDEVNLIIKELESENEKLNAEIWKMASKQSGYEHFLRKENAKLKCLALLYKREMYFAKADKEYKMFCDNQSPLHEINKHHYEVADYEYRKAKKALRDGCNA